ncbi:1,4-alpha-glucan branching protein [Streptomyces sp. NPDC093085]|uniref:maltokinase N-terminal cap-like domain-containing protein n=1 Tax=Streptomyces sp. NPDC093085 TaxID=3155068 RepID=UPI0034398B2D
MAVVHRTTMRPTKLELLTLWLPTRPWYHAGTGTPALSRTGGFRLDDPRGEVGIEFMAVTDTSGERPHTYHIPLGYRGAPLDGAEEALIGTSEHGVLGLRWIYDGAHDPVVVAALLALLAGEAEPQAQSLSDTPDPSVVARLAESARPVVEGAASGAVPVVDGPEGTDLLLRTAGPDGSPGMAGGPLTVRVNRTLTDDGDAPSGAPGRLGEVTAGWSLPDGTAPRGAYAVVTGAA